MAGMILVNILVHMKTGRGKQMLKNIKIGVKLVLVGTIHHHRASVDRGTISRSTKGLTAVENGGNWPAARRTSRR